MQVETLNIFCDVVRHQSFSRAARANSVSQSAASQAVRQLEKHLGAQLIDRSKRPWQLTTEGHLFFKGCQELVERYRDLEQTVRRRQNPSGHTVRLGAIYSVGVHDLTQHVDRFRERVPGASVDLKYMHPDEICERVLSDRFDLGLISFVSPRRELTAILWKHQPMVVTFPPTHRFVALARGRGGVRPADLSRERFVAFDRELPVRREIDRFLRRHRVDVSITAEFDNIETIKQAVDEEAGIAILPEPTVRREVRRETLVQAPFILPTGETPLARPLSIVHRRNRRLNPAVTEFMKLLGVNPADTPPRAPTTIGGHATNDRHSRPPRRQRSTSGDAQGAKA
ncbi:MAG: LysR family transcriptional regulator [Acidobacteriota bacterium]|nr:LysR family transcriptional regulator [Acidobacteriota bacterium]